MQPNETQALLIQASPMREHILGGISDMTLYRLLNDPAQGFPRPIKIGGLRFWNRQEVVAWVESRRAAA